MTRWKRYEINYLNNEKTNDKVFQFPIALIITCTCWGKSESKFVWNICIGEIVFRLNVYDKLVHYDE